MKVSKAIQLLQKIYNEYQDKYEIQVISDIGVINSDCIILDKEYDELYFSYSESNDSFPYENVIVFQGE